MAKSTIEKSENGYIFKSSGTKFSKLELGEVTVVLDGLTDENENNCLAFAAAKLTLIRWQDEHRASKTVPSELTINAVDFWTARFNSKRERGPVKVTAQSVAKNVSKLTAEQKLELLAALKQSDPDFVALLKGKK